MRLPDVSPISYTTIVLLLCACASLHAQPEIKSGQHARSFKGKVSGMTKLNYLLYVPKNAVSTKKKWPLMLFLHGAGERGNNLKQLKKHGPPKIVTRKELPFIIASPQCPKNDWWSDPQRIEGLNTLIDDLIKRYPIDKQRIYLTGLSMGGYGTWHLAAAYPDKFAAIAPICGGGNPKDAGKLANLPTWAFHGAKDNVVPLERSQEMVDALKKAGGDVTFTVYPNANHDSWTKTYNNPELYKWLLSHKATD